MTDEMAQLLRDARDAILQDNLLWDDRMALLDRIDAVLNEFGKSLT